jgi:hypothetical protein
LTSEQADDIARLRHWANAPEQAADPRARQVRALLARCGELLDMVPEMERLRIDLKIAESALKAYRNRDNPAKGG